MSDSDLMQLALLAYECGSEPGLWPTFLERYAHAVAADITVIQIHRFHEHRSDLIATFGVENRFREEYNNHYSRLNAWRENGRDLYRRSDVLLDEELYPREQLKKTPFFNEYLRPLGGVYSLSGVVKRDSENALMLTALRGERRSNWEASDKRIVEFLLPHVRRACSIQQKLAVFEGGEIVLDSLPIGAVLFTASERLIYVNRTAESVFREDDGLLLKDGVLRAGDSMTDTFIQRAIRSAARMDLPRDATEAVLVNRKSMRRPYQLLILPIRRRFSQFADMALPAVMVLITDSERDISATPELIRKLYGLTAKEAELANKVSSGMSPRNAARELGMQYETARTHLKHIYGKMSISRQSELAALIGHLSKLPAD